MEYLSDLNSYYESITPFSFWFLPYKSRKSSFLFSLPSSSNTASGFGTWARVELHLYQSKKPLFSHIVSEVCFQVFKTLKWTFCRRGCTGQSSQYELQSVNVRMKLLSRINPFQGLNCTSEPFFSSALLHCLSLHFSCPACPAFVLLITNLVSETACSSSPH